MSITPEEWSIIKLSMSVALLATLLCLPLSIFLAWLLARKKFWGKSIVNSLVHLPLILPPVVTGYLLLLTFGKKGFVGSFLWNLLGITIAFKWTGAALAAAIMALPLMVRAIRLSIENIDPHMEETARDLGATAFKTFTTITLPLAAPGIAVGTIITFIKALGEFGATITFVSNIPNETQTLSLAIYSFLQTPDGDAAAWRLIIMSVSITFIALMASEKFERILQRRIRSSDL
jgi:molybdate transport system permease protein